MPDSDWAQFVWRAARTTLRYMIAGMLIAGGIGMLIAVATAVFSESGMWSAAVLAGIIWSYAKVGLLGGGIIGLLVGLLTQGSNL